MTSNKIKSTIKGTWNFLIGISNIVSCLAAILSCYIAYHAVLEIVSLNVEINPIIEKFQKDSVVIIERPALTFTPQDNSIKKHSDIQQDNLPVIEQSIESDSSPYLPQSEIEKIRRDRDIFIKKMHLLFGNRERIQ